MGMSSHVPNDRSYHEAYGTTGTNTEFGLRVQLTRQINLASCHCRIRRYLLILVLPPISFHPPLPSRAPRLAFGTVTVAWIRSLLASAHNH
jgi:hypothetical protein